MINEANLYDFLSEIDEDFSPHLSSKVELHQYVVKIQRYAELVIDEDRILRGLVVLYCNDTINYKAYISLVGVRKCFRGQGIARKMMTEAIQIAKDKKMRIIGIHSNNKAALKLYKTLGFVTKEFGEREYLELIL